MSTYGNWLAEKAHEPRKTMRWLWLSLLLLLADQASKYLASTMLMYGESVSVTPFFNWVHRHNTGAAFSFLADAGGWQQPLFIGLALVINETRHDEVLAPSADYSGYVLPKNSARERMFSTYASILIFPRWLP